MGLGFSTALSNASGAEGDFAFGSGLRHFSLKYLNNVLTSALQPICEQRALLSHMILILIFSPAIL